MKLLFNGGISGPMVVQMSFVTRPSAADSQPLVELVLEARAEVTVNVTDVDSLVNMSFC